MIDTLPITTVVPNSAAVFFLVLHMVNLLSAGFGFLFNSVWLRALTLIPRG